MHKLPAPSFILWAQLFGTAVAVKRRTWAVSFPISMLEYDKLRAFFPVALIFCATIFTNIKSLEYANVETFMIFRFDTSMHFYRRLYLPRTPPTVRTVVVVPRHAVAGSQGHALTDAAYVVRGYMFCGLWYFIFCMDRSI